MRIFEYIISYEGYKPEYEEYMRKEILFSILAGIAVGLLIAFGAWRANTAIKTKTESSPFSSQKNSSPTPQPQPLGTTIATPEENDVLTQTPTKVSGITKPNAWVTISGEEEDYVLQAKNDGSFEQEVKLAGGINQILVKVYDKDGVENEQKLTVVFSTEFGKDLETKSP